MPADLARAQSGDAGPAVVDAAGGDRGHHDAASTLPDLAGPVLCVVLPPSAPVPSVVVVDVALALALLHILAVHVPRDRSGPNLLSAPNAKSTAYQHGPGLHQAASVIDFADALEGPRGGHLRPDDDAADRRRLLRGRAAEQRRVLAGLKLIVVGLLHIVVVVLERIVGGGDGLGADGLRHHTGLSRSHRGGRRSRNQLTCSIYSAGNTSYLNEILPR